MIQRVDVVIMGAGAAGLMCAIEAGKRHRNVVVLDHANKAGKKILMSGGGRCNFTNYDVRHEHFISHNPHFCKSALQRYTPYDFIALVKKHRIAFHEKAHGQLFCDNKASDIVAMLLTECEQVGATVQLDTSIQSVEKKQDNFVIKTTRGDYLAASLVIATGGLSIPTMGASALGYKIAEQFGLPVWPTRAGLVPLTLHLEDKEKLSVLSGVAVDSVVSNHRATFRENILLTHRGLSGPAILQMSSYWQPGEALQINFFPEHNLFAELMAAQQSHSEQHLKTWLAQYLPKRVVELFVAPEMGDKPLKALSRAMLLKIVDDLTQIAIKPNGTEGYRTAEVTLGGVDCDYISSKTMETRDIPGLYFIGEVLDVTGWLGGFNFQWAWSSGWAAGQCV